MPADAQSQRRLRDKLKDLFGSIPTVLSPNRSSRRGAAVKLAVIHTTESGPGTLWAIVRFFQSAASQVSSTYVVGDTPARLTDTFCPVVLCVPETEKSWTQRSANPISVSYELIGRASRTRAEWLGRYKVQLDTVAALVAEDCLQYGLPVARDYPGILGHCDLTREGFPNDHTDPGAGFPWDVFLARVAYYVKLGTAPAVPTVVVNAKGRPRPAGVPQRIPSWAWELLTWHNQGKRGARPAAAPTNVPEWYWAWREWRLGVGAHGKAA